MCVYITFMNSLSRNLFVFNFQVYSIILKCYIFSELYIYRHLHACLTAVVTQKWEFDS